MFRTGRFVAAALSQRMIAVRRDGRPLPGMNAEPFSGVSDWCPRPHPGASPRSTYKPDPRAPGGGLLNFCIGSAGEPLAQNTPHFAVGATKDQEGVPSSSLRARWQGCDNDGKSVPFLAAEYFPSKKMTASPRDGLSVHLWKLETGRQLANDRKCPFTTADECGFQLFPGNNWRRDCPPRRPPSGGLDRSPS